MDNLFHKSNPFAKDINKDGGAGSGSIEESKEMIVGKKSDEDLEENELIEKKVNELEDKFKFFIAEAREFKANLKKNKGAEISDEDKLKENPVEYARHIMYETILAEPLKKINLGLGEAKFIVLERDLQTKKESLDKASKELENDMEDLSKNDEERIRLDLVFHEKMEEFNRNRPKELPFIIPSDLFKSENVMFDHLNDHTKLINNFISEGENYLKKINEGKSVKNKEEKVGEIEKKIEEWRTQVAAINSFWESFPTVSKEFNFISEKLGDKERTVAYLEGNVDLNGKKIIDLNGAIKELKKELFEIKGKITNVKAWEEFEKAHKKDWRGQWIETKRK